jgi:hypothetical protein
MVLSKYTKSEFLKHNTLNIVLLVIALLLSNSFYCLYFMVNLNKYYYTYLYSCDLPIFKLLKLTEIWAVTSKLFLIILITHFAIKFKKNVNFRNYVPVREFETLISNAIVFLFYALLFQIFLSVILLGQLYLFELESFNMRLNISDYFKNNFFEYFLNVFLTFIIGYLFRKKVVIMFLLLIVFSFNVKLPFLIGSKNLKVLHAMCQEK